MVVLVVVVVAVRVVAGVVWYSSGRGDGGAGGRGGGSVQRLAIPADVGEAPTSAVQRRGAQRLRESASSDIEGQPQATGSFPASFQEVPCMGFISKNL